MSETDDKFCQNIFSRIHIAIMQASTFNANPSPISKAYDTSRPRITQSAAIRAGLGSKDFVYFLKPRAMLNSHVSQLTTEGRPTCNKNRLGHVGLGKSRARHIAYLHKIKLIRHAGAELVQEITAPIGGLRLDRFDTTFLVGPLRNGQRLFGFSVKIRCSNLFPVREHRKVLKHQINTNAALNGALCNVGNFNADIEKPVVPAIARRVGFVLDVGAKRNTASIKDFELTPVEVKTAGRLFKVTPFEGNPAQVLPTSVAQVSTFPLRARLRVLLTHRVDGAAVNTQLLSGACSELIQIKASDPLATKAKGVVLAVVAVVKDKVHRAGPLVQQAVERFDLEAVHQQKSVCINRILAIQQPLQRLAPALYLPALSDRVSREF
jgi:hypothetical protein